MNRLTNNWMHVVLVVLATGLGTGVAPAAELVLREKFIPTGPVVHLGDIADIHAADGSEARRLATLPLWTAPEEGQQRFASVATIRDAVRLQGVDPSSLEFAGSPRVAIGSAAATQDSLAPLPTLGAEPATRIQSTITPQGTGFRPARSELVAKPEASQPAPLLGAEREALVAKVREETTYYLEQMRGLAGNLDIELRLSPQQMELLSRRTGDMLISGGRAPWTQRQLLSLEFTTNQGPQKFAYTADVLDTTPVLVVRRPLVRGQMITAADVALEPPTRAMRVPAGKSIFSSTEEVLGTEAARAVRPGEVLTSDLCLAPLMMERNEVVTVTVAGGGVELSRQAKALTEARLGEFTEVQLLNSKERLAARVVGPGKLAIADNGPTAARPVTAQREKRYPPR